MAIERQRGISVTASVMTFEHRGLTFNLLDTPGHEDFSEDTYRTLTAVDSAVMVLDAAKGIETQTRKLFEVCRLRDVPIITFVNKVDREGREPFDLLDEIEKTLALDVTPLTWPIGMGRDLRGCYDLVNDRVLLFDPGRGDQINEAVAMSLADPGLDGLVGGPAAAKLREEVELVRAACPPFSLEAYRAGHLTPVFFGSALRNFGVGELLGGLADLAPPPQSCPAEPRAVAADEGAVTGFVFKIQANMDPNHRDRIAFVRLVSGRFRRGMKLKHVRTGKLLAVYNPVLFLARERELADEAVAGDIIGIPNHGALRIGDTLTEGEDLRFTGIPSFAPRSCAASASTIRCAPSSCGAPWRTWPRRACRRCSSRSTAPPGSSASSGSCSSTCWWRASPPSTASRPASRRPLTRRRVGCTPTTRRC